MGRQLERLRNRRKASERLSSLFKQSRHVLVVHYSCESFYDRVDGRTPRVTSIAVRNLASGQTQSFSIHKVAEQGQIALTDISNRYNELEKAMLKEFFDFISTHQNFDWMHWNMRDINYGFQAIEHRYTVLGGKPTKLDEERKFDLSRELIAIYGLDYIEHPRLQKLVKKNDMADQSFLAGKEEAAAFENKEFVKLHQSTLRKVDILANIAERAVNDSLITNATWLKRTRLPTSFLALYSICYAEFSIALSLYLINQHITGHHRIDVKAIPCTPEQIKTLKISKSFRNTCTSVDS